MNNLEAQFLLDPEVVFLNHGSFGATPRPVFEAYQEWQRRFERQPIRFVDRELPGYFAEARQALGSYLAADCDDIVYIPNVTFGVNVVARSLALGPGDEVLATNHEYGACDRAWRFLSRKHRFSYIRQPIPLPIESAEAIVEQFWQGVTSRTRLIFISHITSATALRLPVEAICARARVAGILTLVDGAHAPGQIPLDLPAIGADFYVGNCHKWLCAPKGSGFLYAQLEKQALVEPLIVGWGYEADPTFSCGSDFVDQHQWLGTNDPAAYLTVPDAIRFQAEHDWPEVRVRCRELVSQAIQRIGELTGLPSVYPESSGFYHQMAVAPLPPVGDIRSFKARLYDRFRIEIPCLDWEGWQLIRISIQGYNAQADVDTLLEALADLLHEQ